MRVPFSFRGIPLALLLTALSLEARVVSYAPVTDRVSIPAVQKRTNRYYALIEREDPAPDGAGAVCVCYDSNPRGRLVLHDASGASDPKVVFPDPYVLAAGGAASSSPPPPVGVAFAAVHESGGVPRILVSANLDTSNGVPAPYPQARYRLFVSPDGGATWKPVALPDGVYSPWGMNWGPADVGGPVCRGRGAQVRLGSDEMPFVVIATDQSSHWGVYGVRADGTSKILLGVPDGGSASLLGSNAAGTEQLVLVTSPPSYSAALWALGLDGAMRKVLDLAQQPTFAEGFLTQDGDAYVELESYTGSSIPQRKLVLHRKATNVLSDVAAAPAGGTLFAIPTHDFAGAWIVQRGGGGPTILSRHAPGGAVLEMWRDITAPDVEALHAGASGQRLLVQVHRPRPQMDQRIFKDPALAIWEVGQPAPRTYDELFLSEQDDKGFVNLDVETLASGAPFVFDSGVQPIALPAGGGPSGGSGGGADVVQEWGVVRGSLRQRLLVPGVARTKGAYGSEWKTDLVVRNPEPEPQDVTLRFLSSGGGGPVDVPLTLAANEIRKLPDVLSSVFHEEAAAGALLLLPQAGVNATSRTYTAAAGKSYGTAVPAIDVFAASSPRFPLSFAAALQGAGYRTNLLMADVSGRGGDVGLTLFPYGPRPPSTVWTSAPPLGQRQVNDLASAFGVGPWESGSLVYAPASGASIAGLVAIDNATNDPTFFPPDLPAPVARTIPAIVHADGSNGSRWRSDLHLVNVSDETRTVLLAVKSWNATGVERVIDFTLLPKESRTIPDVLWTLFRMEGVARLRFSSSVGFFFGQESDGVRVTSRTYTADSVGGTYGLPVPPLNSFQSAAAGESLEVLFMAPPPDPAVRVARPFRTNLALVDLNGSSDGSKSRVRVEIVNGAGAVVDGFDVDVPVGGGLQLDDLFFARGLGDGPEAGLIRVTPFGGLVAAYATLIDAGTNDPTYFGAYLAAR